MSATFAVNNDIRLWTDSFGENNNNDSILLISGSAGQGVVWTDNFCKKLARQGYCVIRFDHRDTGLSTHVDFLQTPYRLEHMVTDIQAILKHYNLEKAHIVGSSMGGYVGQLLALQHPECVKSLTLLMTTYDFTSIAYGFMGLPAWAQTLPGPFPEALQRLQALGPFTIHDPDWLEKSLVLLEIFHGNGTPFIREESVELLRIIYERTPKDPLNHPIPHNHMRMCGFGPTCFESDKITVPTHVIHGTHDPIIPIAHGIATAKIIPNSTLSLIEGMGHGRPIQLEDQLIERLCRFIHTI